MGAVEMLMRNSSQMDPKPKHIRNKDKLYQGERNRVSGNERRINGGVGGVYINEDANEYDSPEKEQESEYRGIWAVDMSPGGYSPDKTAPR